MRAIIFILLFLPIIGYSQKEKKYKKSANIDTLLEQLYDSDYFKSLDLLVSPEVYGCSDTGIVHIEFLQDTSSNFNEIYLIHAGIDKREGYNKTYSIGAIYDYMTGNREVGFFVEYVYSNGSKKRVRKTITFDEILSPLVTEYEDAQYSVDDLWVGETMED